MRRYKGIRAVLASVVCGGTLFAPGCGDMVRQSVKDGLTLYVAGSVSSTFGSAQIGDFVFNVLTGGQTGFPFNNDGSSS